jgi:tRNA(Phe) wybutosine-synthesizing methylase Tyw3
MGNVIHKTVPIQVWVDVDEGIVEFVRKLNTIEGVRTHHSCQGTIGEGGAEPYPAYVAVSWADDEARDELKRTGDLVIEGNNFGTLYRP